jgi:2-hydroxycyclohexanecarboxyl-CoA dehydrogenase
VERLMSERVAIVTGGGQGIGAAIAQRLAAEGIAVGIVDRDGQSAERTAEGLPGGLGIGVQADVTDEAQLLKAREAIEGGLGVPGVVVANAGWSLHRPFLETSAEEQSEVLGVNLAGALNTVRVFLPGVIASGCGRVVLISSDSARAGVANQAVYSAAKAGVIGFMKSLALEVVREPVTVNVISPGTTDTPLMRLTFSDDQIERRLRAHPQRRFASPADIASAVIYFVSEEAHFITGQVLSVNGGMLRSG